MPEVQTLPPNTTVLVENRGTKFSLGLLANAGTGYEWKQQLGLGQHAVKYLGEKTIPHGTGPGHQVEFRFEYEAIKDGMAPCRFTLTAPDKEVVKVDAFDFVVTG
jgi:predicted secreted protein